MKATAKITPAGFNNITVRLSPALYEKIGLYTALHGVSLNLAFEMILDDYFEEHIDPATREGMSTILAARQKLTRKPR